MPRSRVGRQVPVPRSQLLGSLSWADNRDKGQHGRSAKSGPRRSASMFRVAHYAIHLLVLVGPGIHIDPWAVLVLS